MTVRQPLLHRRTIAGVATIGLGLPVLAACSGDDGSDVATDPNTPSPSSTAHGRRASRRRRAPASPPSEPPTPSPRPPTSRSAAARSSPTSRSSSPSRAEGEFRCFTAVCTHQGCIVSSVSDGNINCECHGSAFSIADGSVVTGPATQPLGEEQITVEGDAITLG